MITCPRCGLEFESQATTATRCRSCRYVVRVGNSSSADTRRTDASPSEYGGGTAGGAVLVIGAVGLLLVFCVVPRVVRAVRRRRGTTAPTSGPDSAVVGQPPPAPAGGDDGIRALTGPDGGTRPLA